MQLRAKSVLIFVVLLAILYVLISPLPEMAATNSARSLVFVVPLLLSLFLATLGGFFLPVPGQQFPHAHKSRSLLCSRLC